MVPNRRLNWSHVFADIFHVHRRYPKIYLVTSFADICHLHILITRYSIYRNFLNIGTDRSEETLQTRIRLLLEEQSDQGLQCVPFHPHLSDAILS